MHLFVTIISSDALVSRRFFWVEDILVDFLFEHGRDDHVGIAQEAARL